MQLKLKVQLNIRGNTMKLRNNFVYICITVVFFSLNSLAVAENDMAEMQNRLNEQVLSKQFSVQDDASLSKSLDDATERGKPSKSKTQDGYYRYLYNGYYYPHRYLYNGAYYPHPYSYYRHYGYWY
jgi:hypothetical protein